MDYKQIIQEQIETLQAVQKRNAAGSFPDACDVCRIAETILSLCKERDDLPIGER